ncbi:Protein NEP-17 a, partial [Aphelenchoides avenae]
MIRFFRLLTQVLINAPADVQTLIANDNYQVDLYSPAYLDGLMALLKAGNTAGVTPRQLYNYLYYSIIRRYEQRLPEPTVTKKLSFLEAVKRKQKELRNHGGDPFSEIFRKRKPRSPDVNRPAWEVLEPLETDDAGEARLECVEDTMDMLQYASGRAYVDVALPTDASRKNMRDKTGKMLAEVLVAFQ